MTGRRLRDAEKAGIRAAAEYEAAHPSRAKARAEAWAASTQPPGPRTPAPSPIAFSPSSTSSSFSSAPSAAEKALEDLAAARRPRPFGQCESSTECGAPDEDAGNAVDGSG